MKAHTWHGYEGPGEFNVRFKGSHATYRIKNMSVNISTSDSYDFNTLLPAVWKLWRWKDACVSTSRRNKISARFFGAMNEH
jgi:hypothetical protein